MFSSSTNVFLLALTNAVVLCHVANALQADYGFQGPPAFGYPPPPPLPPLRYASNYGKQQSYDAKLEKELDKEEKKLEKEEKKHEKGHHSHHHHQNQQSYPPPGPLIMGPPPPPGYRPQQIEYQNQKGLKENEHHHHLHDHETSPHPGMLSSWSDSMNNAWNSITSFRSGGHEEKGEKRDKGGKGEKGEKGQKGQHQEYNGNNQEYDNKEYQDTKRKRRSSSSKTVSANEVGDKESKIVANSQQDNKSSKARGFDYEDLHKDEYVYLKVPKYLVCS